MTKDELAVIRWLSGRDTGISSEALAYTFLGVKPQEDSPPCDPSDLGRCLRLIRKVPAVRAMVDRLGKKSSRWSRAARAWDQLTDSMKKEVGIDWSKGDAAPNTYDAMKKAGL